MRTEVTSARLTYGLAQAELARAVKTTRPTTGLIEEGKYHSILQLCRKICHQLTSTLGDLFRETIKSDQPARPDHPAGKGGSQEVYTGESRLAVSFPGGWDMRGGG